MSLTGNSMFLNQAGLQMHRGYYDLLKRHGLNRFDALYALSGGELFKKNRYRSVDRIYLGDEEGGRVFHLKRHHPPLFTRLASIFTGFQIRDGAENEWVKILRLEEVGISTMTPVAFGAVRKWGFPYRALTLTEHLYGAQKLEEYLPAHFGKGEADPEKISQKRRLISEVAHWARRFHDAGFHHQDFYLGHIFLKPRDGKITFHIIDLQRVQEHQRLHRSRIVKDLAQINFSALQQECLTRSDRLRFLLAYLGTKHLDRGGKELVRRINGKTRRIASHTRKMLARREERTPVGEVTPEPRDTKRARFLDG